MGLLAWNNGADSATPWAESIRQLIVGEQMPTRAGFRIEPTGREGDLGTGCVGICSEIARRLLRRVAGVHLDAGKVVDETLLHFFPQRGF